jgi:hypothetical protein
VQKGVVAGGSVVVALTALTVLTVVAAVKDVDTLSTVALTLAILAFVIQILVFVVQGYSSNAQMLQAQALHGQMATVLGQIRTQAAGTQSAVDKISDQLLGAALGKATAESAGLDVASTEFAARVQEIIRESVPTAVFATEHRTQGSSDERYDSYPSPSPDPAKVAELLSWPTGATARDLLERFKALSDDGRDALYVFATDELRGRLPASPFGPGLFFDHPSQELIEAGLVARADPPRRRGNEDLFQLTDLGRAVGRLLLAPEPAPAEFRPDFNKVVWPTRARGFGPEPEQAAEEPARASTSEVEPQPTTKRSSPPKGKQPQGGE